MVGFPLDRLLIPRVDLPLGSLTHQATRQIKLHNTQEVTKAISPMTIRIILLCAITAVGLGFSPTSTTFHPPTALKMSTASSPEKKVGDKIPSVVLKEGQADYDKPVDVNIADLIAGKRVAIFAVPGAFTPGCSKSHLPSFITAQDELKSKGVELTICIATNDPYVMEVSGWNKLFIWNMCMCLV